MPSTTPSRIRWATGAWRGSRTTGASAGWELLFITACIVGSGWAGERVTRRRRWTCGAVRSRLGSAFCGGVRPLGAHDVGEGGLDAVQVVAHGLHRVELGPVGQRLDDRPV